MSLSTAQKAEKAYKKSVLGVAMTADDKSYYTEPASPVVVKSKNIWIDDNKIPVTAPTPVPSRIYDEFGDDVTVSLLPGIIQYIEVNLVQIAGAPNSFKTPSAENSAISFIDYNGVYAPVFIDNTTLSVIPVGLNNMEFDSASGTLTFYGGKPAALSSVKAKYWRYVGRTLDVAIAAIAGTIDATSFDLYNGAPNTALLGNVLTLTHNKNIAKLDWNMVADNVSVLPEKLEIVDANTVKVTLDPVPISADNIKIQIIKLS